MSSLLRILFAKTLPRAVSPRATGFTVVELLIVVVVIAIIAMIAVVSYIGVDRRAAAAQVASVAKEAGSAVAVETAGMQQGAPTSMPSSFRAPRDVSVVYVPLAAVHYENLSAVQQGVLFHEFCQQLASDPRYATIHSRDGAQTDTVIVSCDDNVQSDAVQVTGWETLTWSTPLTRESLLAYMDGVSYDTWWTDKQDVIRGFYAALISLYETSGGTWPILSFWDSWATQHSGVPRQNLPTPSTHTQRAQYCIGATHRRYTDMAYMMTADNRTVRAGSCL